MALAAMPLEQSACARRTFRRPETRPKSCYGAPWRWAGWAISTPSNAPPRSRSLPDCWGPNLRPFWFRLAARPCFPESQTQYMTNLLARLKHHRTLKNLAPEAGDALARILSALVDRPGAVRARLLLARPPERRKERLEDDAFVSEYLSGSRGPSPFRLAGQAEIALALADVPPERLIRDAVLMSSRYAA